MNKFTTTITQRSNNALAIVGIVLVSAALFYALVFCKSISVNKNMVSQIEPNRLTESLNSQSSQEPGPGYQQNFLASNTVPQMPCYILPEAEPTGVRLKTIVTR